MDRRQAIQVALAGTLPAVLPASGKEPARLKGVGILYYPPGAYEDAARLAPQIKEGMILLLPNTVNEHGNYEWEFRVEGGSPDQVEQVRS